MQNTQSQRMMAFICFVIFYLSWLPLSCGVDYVKQDCEKIRSKCSKPKTECRCYEMDLPYWSLYEHWCECFNPAKSPKLPTTGVIHWNGLQIFAGPDFDKPNFDWVVDVIDLAGEIHKNSNGNYMKREWTSGNESAASFVILIPDHKGSFTKYTGVGKKQQCKIDEKQPEHFLSSVWERFADWHVSLISEKEKEGKTSIQVWELLKVLDRSFWMHKWTWTVKYDSEKDYAIPLKSIFKSFPKGGVDTLNKTLQYNFQPIAQEDQSFRPEDYCTNL